jgi:hypothetical protein
MSLECQRELGVLREGQLSLQGTRPGVEFHLHLAKLQKKFLDGPFERRPLLLYHLCVNVRLGKGSKKETYECDAVAPTF